ATSGHGQERESGRNECRRAMSSERELCHGEFLRAVEQDPHRRSMVAQTSADGEMSTNSVSRSARRVASCNDMRVCAPDLRDTLAPTPRPGVELVVTHTLLVHPGERRSDAGPGALTFDRN